MDPEVEECITRLGFTLLTLASIVLATRYYLPSLLTYALGLSSQVIG